MSECLQSLLTLLALIFGSIAIFVVFILWWINRYVDRLFDSDRQHIHD